MPSRELSEITADQVWPIIMESQSHGAGLQMAFMLLTLIPATEFDAAINRIHREEAIGPMLNPTAYLDGQLWRNLDQYKVVLRATAVLRRALGEAPE